MIWWQFLVLLAAVPLSVELAIRLRWHAIEAMFAKALMHGGSIDALVHDVRGKAAEAVQVAQEAVREVKGVNGRLDDHHERLKALEAHPVIRFGHLPNHPPSKAPSEE